MIEFRTTNLVKICLLLLTLSLNGFSQSREHWVTLPKEQWPLIALTNHVQYKNGDRYVDPSFNYAGTAFLIDNGKSTLAVTAKHVLWIARNKKSGNVQVNSELKSWILKQKGNSLDSVIVDKLINEDSTELLDGSSSTILERDWIIFSIKNASSAIYPLKPRYTSVKPGEDIYIIGNPYSENKVKIYEGKVLRKLGMDILIEQFPNESIPGISGSPVIDSNGFLIGIFSSTSTDAVTGKNISVAISTEYLKGVLDGNDKLNDPRKDYGDLIFQTVLKQGTKKAIQQYNNLTSNPRNFYVYNLRSANRNGLLETGERLVKLKRYNEAVEILEFNVKVNSSYFHNYNRLANAWLLAGNREEAVKNYSISTTKFDDRDENEAFGELEKLDVLKGRNKKQAEKLIQNKLSNACFDRIDVH